MILLALAFDHQAILVYAEGKINLRTTCTRSALSCCGKIVYLLVEVQYIVGCNTTT